MLLAKKKYFKSTLDDLQERADNLSDTIRTENNRKTLLCALCVGLIRSSNDPILDTSTSTPVPKTWRTLPLRFGVRLWRFAGSYGFYFLGMSYIFYWFLTYYIARTTIDVLGLDVLNVLVCLVFLGVIFFLMGSVRIANSIKWCCGSLPKMKKSNSKTSLKRKSHNIRDENVINPCGAKLLILSTILSTIVLSTIMIFHSLYDVAHLGSLGYSAANQYALEYSQYFNWKEVEFRDKVNGVLDAPVSRLVKIQSRKRTCIA